MNRDFKLICFLVIVSGINLYGQNEIKLKKFSIAAGYAPVTTFYFPGVQDNIKFSNSRVGITEIIYPFGFNIRAVHKFNNKFSLNSGFNYKRIKNEFTSSAVGLFAYSEKSTSKKQILEIPLYLNYRYLNSNGVLEPYFSAGLRLSDFEWDHEGNYTRYISGIAESGNINNHERIILVLFGLGSGTYININKSFSFVIEANITCTRSYFGYLEIFSGISYSF